MRKNPERFWVERDVEGVVGLGFPPGEEKSNQAISAQTNLAPDFEVMETYHPTPGLASLFVRIGLGIWAVALGLGALISLIWLLARRRRRTL